MKLEDLQEVAKHIEEGSLKVRQSMTARRVEKKTGKLWFVKDRSLFLEQQLMHEGRPSSYAQDSNLFYTVTQDYLIVQETYGVREHYVSVYTRRSKT